mmetsp:Transcript_13795/g.44241  ORF Transcript_13795/g.44241 Transcript_13795/m.44241 type:complete len:323 (-) Transcript_13795:729-1697(-)
MGQAPRDAPVVAARPQQALRGGARARRRVRRPDTLKPHQVQGRRRLPGGLARGALHPLRRARARDGRPLQRDAGLRHAPPLLRNLPQLFRLRGRRGARLRPLALWCPLHRDARLDRTRRGRAHPPARRGARQPARHAELDHAAARRRERGCRRVHGRDGAPKDAGGDRALKAGLRQPRRVAGGGGCAGRLRAAASGRRAAAAGAGRHRFRGADARAGGAAAGGCARAARLDAVLRALRHPAARVQARGAAARRARAGDGGPRGGGVVQVRALGDRHALLRLLGAGQGGAEALRLHGRQRGAEGARAAAALREQACAGPARQA